MVNLREPENKSSSPKVSVIIPAYNASKFIREAIDSVLNQTYKDYEIIVVDGRDGSADDTREIIAEYGDAVRYFHQENTGLSNARNKGILNSKGEYIAFLDSDDFWFENKLALQVEFLDRHRDVGLVFSDSWCEACGDVNIWDQHFVGRRFFQKTKPPSGEVFFQLFCANFIPVLTVVVRKECLSKVGLFNEEYNSAEDYDLWLRVSRAFKVHYIDEPLAAYRIRGDSLVHNRERLYSNLISIKRNTLRSEPELFKRFNQKELNKIFFRLHANLGNYFLFTDNPNKARGKYMECMSLNPYNPLVYIMSLMTFLPIQFRFLSWVGKSLKMEV